MSIELDKRRNQDPDDEYSTGDAMSFSVGSMGDEDTMGDGRRAPRDDGSPQREVAHANEADDDW